MSLGEESMPQTPDFDLGEMIIESPPPSPSRMTAHVPERQPQEDFFTPSTYQQKPSPVATVAAYGLHFTPENLAKMPEQLLGYITQCIEHQIRQANNTEDLTLRTEYRSQSTLLRNYMPTWKVVLGVLLTMQ